LAEMVREDGIAFPPCLGDFVKGNACRTIGLFDRRRNRISFAISGKTRVVCAISSC
jgi:hypothetical protein